MTAPDAAPARRRPTVVAAVLLFVAAAALWGAGRMTWVRVYSADGLGADRVTDLGGGEWAAATTPLALALLAAVAAAFAVRGRALRVVAVAVGLVGVAAAVPAVQLLATGAAADTAKRIAALPARAEVTALDVFRLPALLVLAGALVAVAAAVVLWRTPLAQAGLSSKYDNPAARRDATARRAEAAAPMTERTLWDALDAGHDPTADASPESAGDDAVDDPDGAARGDSGEPGTRRSGEPGTRRSGEPGTRRASS